MREAARLASKWKPATKPRRRWRAWCGRVISRGPLFSFPDAGFGPGGGFSVVRFLGCAQAKEEDADGFAEEAVDGLPVLQLDLCAEGGEASLRANDGIHDGMQSEVGVEVGAERAVCDAFSNEGTEDLKALVVKLSLQDQEAFHGPVAGVHGIELGHEADPGGVCGELIGHEVEEAGDFAKARGCVVDELFRVKRGIFHGFAEEGPDDVVLVGEVLVDGGGAELAGGDELGHGGAVDALLVEEVCGGCEDSGPLAVAVGAVGAGFGLGGFGGHRMA